MYRERPLKRARYAVGRADFLFSLAGTFPAGRFFYFSITRLKGVKQ
jgi:hypothetical protein